MCMPCYLRDSYHYHTLLQGPNGDPGVIGLPGVKGMMGDVGDKGRKGGPGLIGDAGKIVSYMYIRTCTFVIILNSLFYVHVKAHRDFQNSMLSLFT